MRYLLRTNTSYKHLATKFERAVSTCVGRDGSEMAVGLRRFFARLRFLASENGLYELASTFCHVAPGHSNLNLTKKGLKIESFLQKTLKFFCVFFSETPVQSHKFSSPMPPFGKIFIRYIKLSVKKNGRPGRSETGNRR